jgi:hypothetical protein
MRDSRGPKRGISGHIGHPKSRKPPRSDSESRKRGRVYNHTCGGFENRERSVRGCQEGGTISQEGGFLKPCFFGMNRPPVFSFYCWKYLQKLAIIIYNNRGRRLKA